MPGDLKQPSPSGTRRLLVLLALCVLFLFGMELRSYLTLGTFSSVVVDRSADGELLRIQLDISFPELPCEFASVDVSDVLGTEPAWKKAAKIIRERYDPVMDGRILIGNVDCTKEAVWCQRNGIQDYPFIRTFRYGSDLSGVDGNEHLERKSYYGERDIESLVAMMESKVASAAATGGCRIEGFLHVKKVPGNLIISARSASHSFDSSKINMSHVVSHLSFGNPLNAKLLSDMKRWSPYIGASHGRLDGKSFITPHNVKENVTIEHYLQVVKTQLVSKRGLKEESLLEEYEYTAQSSIAQSQHMPVAKFHMELSPLQV